MSGLLSVRPDVIGLSVFPVGKAGNALNNIISRPLSALHSLPTSPTDSRKDEENEELLQTVP